MRLRASVGSACGHEWWGLNDYSKKRAEQLAGLGYVAFAIDMYGKGKPHKIPKKPENGRVRSETIQH